LLGGVTAFILGEHLPPKPVQFQEARAGVTKWVDVLVGWYGRGIVGRSWHRYDHEI
jgi:hypothetical protein